MTPVSGLRVLQRLRPGTAEVSLRHVSGWVIGGCRSSNLTVSNAALANASIDRHRYPQPTAPVSAERALGLVPGWLGRLSVRQGFCSSAREARPLARPHVCRVFSLKAVWHATRAAS